jgi:hypothetical protein
MHGLAVHFSAIYMRLKARREASKKLTKQLKSTNSKAPLSPSAKNMALP